MRIDIRGNPPTTRCPILTATMRLARRGGIVRIRVRQTIPGENVHQQEGTEDDAIRHQVHPNQVSTWKRQAVEGILGETVQREFQPVY